jgi:hypothetical protein
MRKDDSIVTFNLTKKDEKELSALYGSDALKNNPKSLKNLDPDFILFCINSNTEECKKVLKKLDKHYLGKNKFVFFKNKNFEMAQQLIGRNDIITLDYPLKTKVMRELYRENANRKQKTLSLVDFLASPIKYHSIKDFVEHVVSYLKSQPSVIKVESVSCKNQKILHCPVCEFEEEIVDALESIQSDGSYRWCL